jgi:hypothetical protein
MSEKQPWMLKKTRQRATDRRANNQPPEHSRFQPGRSGNPKGRPKGRLSPAALLMRILNEKVEIREGNRFRKMSKFEAMHHTLVHSALKGDAKAFTILRELVEQDPSTLPLPPVVQLIFGTDREPEELEEWEAWRAARKSGNTNPPDNDSSQ